MLVTHASAYTQRLTLLCGARLKTASEQEDDAVESDHAFSAESIAWIAIEQGTEPGSEKKGGDEPAL